MDGATKRNARTWWIGALGVSIVALGVWAFSRDAAGQTEPAPGTLATVAGRPITRAEVEQLVAGELREVERQRHSALEQGLDRAVTARLVGAAAAEAGLDTDAYLQREVTAKVTPPTTAEVDAFYEQNKASIKQPKEAIAGQIREYLIQQRAAERRSALFKTLREKYRVISYLEPMRIPVADAGFPAQGPANAPITIVEFSDFQCPFCSRVNPTLEQVKKTYAGKVRLVFRHFPLKNHADAWKAAEASLCANDQGKFWEMHDAMFADQRALAVPSLKATAARIGLAAARFDECLDSGRYGEKVQADLDAGQEAGVNGTPGIFINGRFINGAVPFEQMAAVINDELQRSARP
jgi:protein-disulfide isomerase